MRTLRKALEALEGTLESLIKDRDLRKVEAVAMLKAAEASKEFQEHAGKEPWKHHIVGVRIGDEEFRIDEQQMREQVPANFFDEQLSAQSGQQTQTASAAKTYEGNINTAVFDCTCGKKHEGFTPGQAHEAAGFEKFASEYGANIASDKEEKEDDSKYSPAASKDAGDSLYLRGGAAETDSFGSSEYLAGASGSSQPYEVGGKQKKQLYHS